MSFLSELLGGKFFLSPYNDEEQGITSMSGRIGQFGGTVGFDRGMPFGSANVGGRVIGEFGPQGEPARIPTGARIPQRNMQSFAPDVQGMAQIYNQNPQDPRVSGVDPAVFGYEPDDGGSRPIVQRRPNRSSISKLPKF